VIFTFSSFNLLHFIHPNAVAVVAHIPWLLWSIDIVLKDALRNKVYSALSAIALLTGSQLLLGYPQFVWFSLLTELVYAIYVLIIRRHIPRQNCGPVFPCHDCVGCYTSTWPDIFMAKCIGVFIGGVQLLPTIDALLHSARQSAHAAFALTGSMHPLNLLQLVAPYLFVDRVVGQNTHELGLYLGAVPLMLIVWLIVQMVRVRKKIKKIAAEQAQQDTGWSGTGGLSPRESDQAPAGLAAGHAIVQAPADALIVIAGAALFMAIGVALWLGTAPGGWDPTASRFSAQEQLQSMLRDVSIVYVIYAAFMATAGLLMRRLRVRLFVLLCVVLVGVLLPTILALNVVMELEHIPAWPVLVPMWLGMPVAVWATGVLFRQDVREAFARPGVSVP